MHASEQPWSEHNIWLASTGVMLLDSHPQALLLTKSAQYSPHSYLAKFGWILRTSADILIHSRMQKVTHDLTHDHYTKRN